MLAPDLGPAVLIAVPERPRAADPRSVACRPLSGRYQRILADGCTTAKGAAISAEVSNEQGNSSRKSICPVTVISAGITRLLRAFFTGKASRPGVPSKSARYALGWLEAARE